MSTLVLAASIEPSAVIKFRGFMAQSAPPIGTEIEIVIETETETAKGNVNVSGSASAIVIDDKSLLPKTYPRKKRDSYNSSSNLNNNKIINAANSNFHILIRSRLALWGRSVTASLP